MGRNTEDKNTLVPIHFLNALVILPSLASGGDARTKVIGSKNIKKKHLGARERLQCLGALAFLAENLGSVPSSHIRQLRTIWKLQLQRFWPPLLASNATCRHEDQTHTQACNKKMN